MNEWMNEWMNELINQLINELINLWPSYSTFVFPTAQDAGVL